MREALSFNMTMAPVMPRFVQVKMTKAYSTLGTVCVRLLIGAMKNQRGLNCKLCTSAGVLPNCVSCLQNLDLTISVHFLVYADAIYTANLTVLQFPVHQKHKVIEVLFCNL